MRPITPRIRSTIDANGDGQPDGWESGPPADVNDWEAHPRGLESCPNNPKVAFFWSSPFIYDKKTYVDPGKVWAGLPVYGTPGANPFDAYKQWVAIKVPICGDPTRDHRFLVKGPYVVYRYHAGDSKIIDVIQQPLP